MSSAEATVRPPRSLGPPRSGSAGRSGLANRSRVQSQLSWAESATRPGRAGRAAAAARSSRRVMRRQGGLPLPMMFCLPLPTREPVTGKCSPPITPYSGPRAALSLDQHLGERRMPATHDQDDPLVVHVHQQGLLGHGAHQPDGAGEGTGAGHALAELPPLGDHLALWRRMRHGGRHVGRDAAQIDGLRGEREGAGSPASRAADVIEMEVRDDDRVEIGGGCRAVHVAQKGRWMLRRGL